ncbi:MAG: alpha/beta hydrolase [Rhodospirillales bacterium]|nr:alpha/beta hydrolase [Rhodospirillales bacterium]
MTDLTPPENSPPQILARDDGATIAYHRSPGKSPGIVFLTGFMSDMTGSKALALEAYCRDRGRAFLRFDYTGHGQSSGAFTDGTIGQWAADAVYALDKLTDGPQVLVGSSMGGWIMLLTTLLRPQRVAGLLGTAAAPDFTRDLMEAVFTPDQQKELAETGQVLIPSDYEDGDPYPITKALIEDGRDQLLLDREIPLDCPVRLIHGQQDRDVPWQTSMRLAECLRSRDVEVTLIKEGDHRLSEPHDLDRLIRILDKLLHHIDNPPGPEQPN